MGVRVAVAQQVGLGYGDAVEMQSTDARCTQTHAGVRLDTQPGAVRLDDEESGTAVEFGGDDEQLAGGGRRHEALDARELVAAGERTALVCSANGSKSARGSFTTRAALGTFSPVKDGRYVFC